MIKLCVQLRQDNAPFLSVLSVTQNWL